MKLKVYLASKNRKKAKEVQTILDRYGIEVHLPGRDMEFPPEDSDTFEGNALNKAIFLSKFYPDDAVIADDSGLVVYALGGKPGVYSSRFAGPEKSDAQNIKKLLEHMENVKNRKAYFICVSAVVLPGGKSKTFEGRLYGVITKEERGNNGFGYDPVFEIPGIKKTVAELSEEAKDNISHRGKALRKLAKHLTCLNKF
ncbi:MAG: RdgB/HAM1 family non-canonical purine NTP pyrophosphatase [Actinobacteria bacterium]|nr:RdgB/HAM1 family non-canonical purine NTP pyrophosphatase [Actinomycetota bacterium]MCL5408807.1 RdgB/HAM1 family non-canonical purine NTP pyrophosphatase [Candidatus Omnitrophota bacterium]